MFFFDFKVWLIVANYAAVRKNSLSVNPRRMVSQNTRW